MPMPCTIVTFKDADGDEFPIRVEGDPRHDAETEGLARIRAVDAAGSILNGFVDRGEMRPTFPVTAEVDYSQWD